MWTYKAKILHIVDGDTVDAEVSLGFYMWARIRFRIARINTPEVRGDERPEGLEAEARVRELMPEGTEVTIATRKAGKFGRWIGEVTLDDGRNLSDVLVEEGHAVYVDY